MKEFYGLSFIVAASALAVLSACDDSSSPSDEAASSSAIATVASSSSSEEITVSPSSSGEAVPAVETSSSSETAETSSSNEVASSSSAMTINYLGQILLRVPEGGAFSWKAEACFVSHVGDTLVWMGGGCDTSFEQQYNVNTGLDKGNEASGYWHEFDDRPDGGYSSFDWPVEYGSYVDEYQHKDPVIDKCGGLCGTFTLHKKDLAYNPFVGIGFCVADEDNEINCVAADASAWGGLCVAYISTENALLQLGLSTKFTDPETDSPAAELPKSAEGTVVCVPWSKFTKSLQGESPISAEEAAKNLVSVKIVFQGEDGTEGTFNVMSIGSYVEQ